jgi:hypothetical protein
MAFVPEESGEVSWRARVRSRLSLVLDVTEPETWELSQELPAGPVQLTAAQSRLLLLLLVKTPDWGMDPALRRRVQVGEEGRLAEAG